MPVNMEVLGCSGIQSIVSLFHVDPKNSSVYGDFIIVYKMGVGYWAADFCAQTEIMDWNKAVRTQRGLRIDTLKLICKKKKNHKWKEVHRNLRRLTFKHANIFL